MSKPVNKKEFWKDRIEKAKTSKEHYSVYITSDEDWSSLNKAHKTILEPYKHQKVLDAGCGYGRWSELFVNYTGVDFSPDFIEKAKATYPDQKFLIEDLKSLPFKDNEFDMAFCVSIKQMIVDNLGQDEWNLMEKELLRVSEELLILEYTNPHEYQRLKSK